MPTLATTVVVVFETEGATRESLATVVLLALGVLGPLPLLFRSALRTEVRDDGVSFRFSPFRRSDRHVPCEEIEDIRRSERCADNFGLKRTRWGWKYRPDSTEGLRSIARTGRRSFRVRNGHTNFGKRSKAECDELGADKRSRVG